MHKLNRKSFLAQIQAVKPGLAKREVLPQSSCAVFDSGMVFSFNEECAVRTKSGLPNEFRCAVKAQPLVDLLGKLPDDEIEIVLSKSELRIAGENRSAGITMQTDVRLQIGEVETPITWQKASPDFIEAISLASECASTDDSVKFPVRCLNITPDWIEATDNTRLIRYTLRTGFSQQSLVKANSIKHILDFNIVEFSETNKWVHFRDDTGTIISCKRYWEAYPDVSRIIELEHASSLGLPSSISQSTKLASIFLNEATRNNKLTCQIKNGTFTLRGQDEIGWYEEEFDVPYDGRPISFSIKPKLLAALVSRYNSVMVADRKIKIFGPDNKWEMVVYLSIANSSASQTPEPVRDTVEVE